MDNLEKITPDCAFELYMKSDTKHFKLEWGQVDLASKDTPLGIGIQKEVDRVPMELLRSPGTMGRGGREEMDYYEGGRGPAGVQGQVGYGWASCVRAHISHLGPRSQGPAGTAEKVPPLFLRLLQIGQSAIVA